MLRLPIFLSCCLAAGPLAGQLSRFDFDTENWSANSDAAGHIARFDPAHGKSAPSIYAIDSNTGLPWYFVAPTCFLGNQGHNYGDSLTFDFYINIYGSTPYTNDIILQGNGQTLVHNHAHDPATHVWNHLGARLDESDWHLNSGAGANPTQAEFQQILTNLTDLEIRGEYKTGVDTAWLDNVRFGHAPVTLLDLRLPEGTEYVLPDGHAVRDTSLDTTFYLKSSLGCDSTVRVRLDYIYYNVFIPNAFRPNDDGLNERFTLFTNADGREIRSLEIWNRWGELLFRRAHFPPGQLGGADGWDGTFRGEAAPAGVYVWRAEVEFVDGRVLLFSGDLTLLR